MDADTSVLAERAKGNPVFFQSVSVVLDGRIAFSPGGVLVKTGGEIVGAVGSAATRVKTTTWRPRRASPPPVLRTQ
jgi:uncharacterized protein GlcG (DUF336 family)